MEMLDGEPPYSGQSAFNVILQIATNEKVSLCLKQFIHCNSPCESIFVVHEMILPAYLNILLLSLDSRFPYFVSQLVDLKR